MTRSIDLSSVRALVPKRRADTHKGTFGHVCVIAGSRGFTGAAKLACEAAARSGVGLVTAAVPESLGDLIGASLLEAMSFLLPATESESIALNALEPALEFAASKEAIVIGPGLSQDPDTCAFVLEFVRRCPVPTLIDADGLNALGANPSVLLHAAGPRVLTPHPGEMARLMARKTAYIQENRESVASSFAEQYRCVVVLKGYETVVAGKGECFINTTGNSGLATGGTGDVLSGLIGGLLAQGIKELQAAVLGVYLHGLAGDIAAVAKTQRGMIARDVIEAIPEAWKRIEELGVRR